MNLNQSQDAQCPEGGVPERGTFFSLFFMVRISQVKVHERVRKSHLDPGGILTVYMKGGSNIFFWVEKFTPVLIFLDQEICHIFF